MGNHSFPLSQSLYRSNFRKYYWHFCSEESRQKKLGLLYIICIRWTMLQHSFLYLRIMLIISSPIYIFLLLSASIPRLHSSLIPTSAIEVLFISNGVTHTMQSLRYFSSPTQLLCATLSWNIIISDPFFAWFSRSLSHPLANLHPV